MVRIYLRHSLKEHDNSPSLGCDPGITPTGSTLARTQFTALLREYPPPNRLVVSPYLRTRQTAQILSGLTGCPITYDARIGEYLGNWNRYNIKNLVTLETWYRGARILNRKNFELGVRQHDLEERNRTDCSWYISHGLTIQAIGKNYGVSYYPNEMNGIIIENGLVRIWS